MAWTTPGTAIAGDVLTASFWNSNVRDNLNAIAGAPFARNILYNGQMQVSQRSTSLASITGSGYWTTDRWATFLATLGTWTQSVQSDGPAGTGIMKSLKMLCTTADASPAAADVLRFEQVLEGQDLQRIMKGSANALQITMSFWVKSNVTGTYIVWLYDNDNNRHVSASYTISASGTWEYKTITFPADTTGAFDNDNAASLYVSFILGAGSDRTSGTLATSWATYTAANVAPGQTNLASAINNYWQVTGVQLEVGSAATGFEFLPFADELSRCQRYYLRLGGGASNGIWFEGYNTSGRYIWLNLTFPVTMRSAPLGSTFGTGWSGFNVSSATPSISGLTPSGAGAYVTVSSTGMAYSIVSDSTTGLAFSAEL